MLRADVLREARSWVGTPFHHQQCIKGLGVDCGQLITGVAVALGVMDMPGADWRRYGRVPDPAEMERRLDAYLIRIGGSEAGPGDVAFLWQRRGIRMHLGILTDLHGRGILHATIVEGRVVETRLSDAMLLTVGGWWRFPGLED